MNGVLNDEDFFKKKAQIEDEILDLKEKRLNIEENSNFLNRDKIRKYLVKLSKKNRTVKRNSSTKYYIHFRWENNHL